MKTKISWPLKLSYNLLYGLMYAEEKTVRFFDTKTGNLLSTFISTSERKTGIEIHQNGNIFHVKHWKENEAESYELVFDELLLKLAEWNK